MSPVYFGYFSKVINGPQCNVSFHPPPAIIESSVLSAPLTWLTPALIKPSLSVLVCGGGVVRSSKEGGSQEVLGGSDT